MGKGYYKVLSVKDFLFLGHTKEEWGRLSKQACLHLFKEEFQKIPDSLWKKIRTSPT
jgi:hypothetical protein